MYKPNVVYVCEIDKFDYYIGCHCHNRGLRDSTLLQTSGNPLNVARQKGQLSLDEYKKRCKVISIEEYNTPEEALDREDELIAEYKAKFGEHCLNKYRGNKYGPIGVVRSEETRRKISQTKKGHKDSEEACIRKAKAHGINGIQQFDLSGKYITEYPSIGAASRQTGINRGSISHCLTGISKSAGNYHWKYA